jgi:hypothetical protein
MSGWKRSGGWKYRFEPGLDEVLSAITVRVAVEIAKRKPAVTAA